MPCWPDLWDRFKHLLPFLGSLVLLIVYIAFTSFLLWAPKFRKRWQRIASRIVGAVAVLPLVIELPGVIFGLMLASGNPPTQTELCGHRTVKKQN